MFIVIHPNLVDVQFCGNMASELISKLQAKRFIVEECKDRNDGINMLLSKREKKYYPTPRVRDDLLIKAIQQKIVVKRSNKGVLRETVVRIPCSFVSVKTQKKESSTFLESIKSYAFGISMEELSECENIVHIGDSQINLLSDFDKADFCDSCNIYIDGAYRPEDTHAWVRRGYGSGIYIKTGDKRYYIDTRTVNDYERSGSSYAELVTMMYCLYIIKELGFKRVTIFHDAQCLITDLLASSSKNLAIGTKYREYFYEVAKMCEITLVKVKGHSTVKGNRVADHLAGVGVLRRPDLENPNLVERKFSDVFYGNMSIDDLNIEIHEEGEISESEDLELVL